MKKIKAIIRELERSLGRMEVFILLLKTLVILMVFYLFLSIISIEPYYAFIPAFIYFISSLVIEARLDKLKIVEKKYNFLNEKLITARDYQNKDNSILDNLEEEIITGLKEVEVSRFFQYSTMLLMVFLLVLIVSSSLFMASEGIKVVDFNGLIKDAIKRFNQQENETIEAADFTGGRESIMQVGNERLQVEIKPVGMDINFNEPTETADYDFSTSFPKEVIISSGAAYENEFSEEQQVLIKRYFEKKKHAG